MSRIQAVLKHDVYDVLICGGGMIGTVMALALGKNEVFKDYRIGVIESGPEKRFIRQETYSNRVSAINYASKGLFEKLGIWKNISRFGPVNDMKVWGSFSRDCINYSDSVGLPIAFIIENDEIIESTIEEIRKMPNIDLLYNAKLASVTLNQGDASSSLPQVNFEDGSQQKCRLLIGADGANSLVRKEMGSNYLTWKYDQTAVVATLKTSKGGMKNTAWQRFLPDGPIALLPLTDEISSLVWSTTPRNAKNLLQIPHESFADAVNEALHSDPLKDPTVEFWANISSSLFERAIQPMSTDHVYCPQILELLGSSRASFPLGFGHCSQYVGPRTVLIGDAAHKVHPLAGQGVNLGYRDIILLTEKLTESIMCGKILGDYGALKQYETASQKANLPIMFAIDMIYRIYTSNLGPIRAFGNLGIRLTESFNPIKTLMKQVASN